MAYAILLYWNRAYADTFNAIYIKSVLCIASTSVKSLALQVAYLGYSEKKDISPKWLSCFKSLTNVFVFLWIILT
jgi:hypothetical protein